MQMIPCSDVIAAQLNPAYIQLPQRQMQHGIFFNDRGQNFLRAPAEAAHFYERPNANRMLSYQPE
jgi:hypothetical protein